LRRRRVGPRQFSAQSLRRRRRGKHFDQDPHLLLPVRFVSSADPDGNRIDVGERL